MGGAILLVGLIGCARPSASGAQKELPTERLGRIEPYVPKLSSFDTCRNAVDDNDDGFIDEGCAESRAGRLEVLLAWFDGRVDLDLIVIDPAGGASEVGRATASGLTKLVDCPADTDCRGQNYEKVVLEKGTELSPGRYLVEVRRIGSSGPVSFQLGVQDRHRTSAYRGTLETLESRAVLEFEVEPDAVVRRIEKETPRPEGDAPPKASSGELPSD